MIKIDAIGQICPMPIIMTKNALKEISEGTIEISVDNKISKENIEKFAHEMNFHYLTEEKDNLFFIQITKTLTDKVENKKSNDTVIVIDSDKMGQGDDALGETLMKGFIYTLTEIEELPKAILFYNRGVFLTSLIKSSVKDLLSLQERGVEILSCGACINFYNLEDKLSVGTATNMYNIVTKQLSASKVIKP